MAEAQDPFDEKSELLTVFSIKDGPAPGRLPLIVSHVRRLSKELQSGTDPSHWQSKHTLDLTHRPPRLRPSNLTTRLTVFAALLEYHYTESFTLVLFLDDQYGWV